MYPGTHTSPPFPHNVLTAYLHVDQVGNSPENIVVGLIRAPFRFMPIPRRRVGYLAFGGMSLGNARLPTFRQPTVGPGRVAAGEGCLLPTI